MTTQHTQVARHLPLRADLPRCACLPRTTAEHHGINGAYYLTLDDFVLVDGDVSDARYILHVDVLKRAAQLPGRRDGFAIAVANVEIDITPDATGKACLLYTSPSPRDS